MVRFCSVLVLLGWSVGTARGDGPRVQVRPRPPLVGQEPAVKDRAGAFRVSSGLVVVPVTVLNSQGAPLRGLTREAFRLYEDGVEQKIYSFGEEDGPVSIGIVFDASKSMQPKLAEAREAVARIFEAALPGDEYNLVEFNDYPRLLCELTRDTDVVRSALGQVAAQGWTALYDGVMLSAHSMRRAKNARRALVVLSDGEDNISRYDEGEVKSYLAEANVVIYSIGLSGGPFSSYQTRHLRRLSEITGGRFYPIAGIGRLGEAVRAIGDAIRNQYVLGYSSSNPQADGKYRRIRVRMEPQGKLELSSSWRTGYYAPDSR